MPRGVCFVIDRHKAGFLWVTAEDPPMPDDAVIYAETEREIQYTDWQTLAIKHKNIDQASNLLVGRFGGKACSYSYPMPEEDRAELIAAAVLNG